MTGPFLPSLVLFLRSLQEDTITEGHRCHGCKAAKLPQFPHSQLWLCSEPPHQWRQQLHGKPNVLSLWGRVHYEQIWTLLAAASQGTGRRPGLLGWTAAISWTHWLSSLDLLPSAYDKSKKAWLLGNDLILIASALSTSSSGKFQTCGPLCSLGI